MMMNDTIFADVATIAQDALHRLELARAEARRRGLEVPDHPDVLAVLKAAIQGGPVSAGEVADAVDAALAMVARIAIRLSMPAAPS